MLDNQEQADNLARSVTKENPGYIICGVEMNEEVKWVDVLFE